MEGHSQTQPCHKYNLTNKGHQVLKEPRTAHQEEPGSEPGLWDVQTHAVP